jgi:CBS domain-containing protein
MKIKNVLDAKGDSRIFSIPTTYTLTVFVKEACERKVGALLVTDEHGKMAGIISERDVIRQCYAKADFDTMLVSEVMTKNLITASPDHDIHDAMDILVQKKIRHLPILEGDEIKGLITVRDLISAMRKADKDETHLLVEYLQSSFEAL